MNQTTQDGFGRQARERDLGLQATRFYALVDSTLREGEQFESGDFTATDKLEIARALSEFGVEYRELTSPAASPGARSDCERIAALGLASRIVAHIRCH